MVQTHQKNVKQQKIQKDTRLECRGYKKKQKPRDQQKDVIKRSMDKNVSTEEDTEFRT